MLKPVAAVVALLAGSVSVAGCFGPCPINRQTVSLGDPGLYARVPDPGRHGAYFVQWNDGANDLGGPHRDVTKAGDKGYSVSLRAYKTGTGWFMIDAAYQRTTLTAAQAVAEERDLWAAFGWGDPPFQASDFKGVRGTCD